MGNQQSGAGSDGSGKKNDKGEKKKYEPPVPTRVGKKRKRVKGKLVKKQKRLKFSKWHLRCKYITIMLNNFPFVFYRTRYCIQVACCNTSYQV